MKQFTCLCLVLAVLLVVTVTPASTQDFAPDRPGFSTGTFTMQPKSYTLEAGYEFERNASANPRLPGLNFRYGLTSKMEVSLAWSGLQMDKQDGDAEYDLPVPAMKYRVLQRDALEVTFVGALAVSGDLDLDPFAGFMFELDLDGAFGLFGGVQSASYSFADKREWESNLMLGLGFDASDALSLFTEFYNGIMSAPVGNYVMNQTGLTYMLRETIQLDLYYGWSLDGDIPSFGGFGVAFML